jgi:hypothetical protein
MPYTTQRLWQGSFQKKHEPADYYTKVVIVLLIKH